jgi:hypothetical protein
LLSIDSLLFFPIASISSINIIADYSYLACSKSLLILYDPTPTNISINSDPLAKKNGTPASPAIDLAKRVLPVPGGPDKSAPLGNLAPIY